MRGKDNPMKMQADLHWARRLTSVLPRRRVDVDQSTLDGEAVLYDRRTGCTHRLNATALAVWRGCDGGSTTEDLATKLTEIYEVDWDQALFDIEQSVATFAQAELVTAGQG